MIPIDEIDVGGKDSDKEAYKKNANEPLVLGADESPTVLIEVRFEATNNYTQVNYPVKVKSESKFAQPFTLKLHKQSTYTVRVKLTSTAKDLNVDSIEEMSIEGARVVFEAPRKLKGGEHGIRQKGKWNMPVKAQATADTTRHALPFLMNIKVSRRGRSLVAKFHEEIQAKIYSNNVNNMNTGQALIHLMLGCDIKTQSSGGINYVVAQQ